MPVGRWSARGHKDSGSDWEEAWDQRTVSRDVSPDAFMEELCNGCGGYRRFFRTLLVHYFGWWLAVVAVPAMFLDHHKCEVNLPYLPWFLYALTVMAMLGMAVLLELSVVQKLGLLRPGEISELWSEPRWRMPLVGTLLWKLDAYTDVAFIFVARDCGSSLWWASLATFVFGVVFGQLLFNSCFACTDCDRELPSSFGFFMLDFKLVNTAVRHVLPFDPDASHLPVAKTVTLRNTQHIVGMEKLVGDVAQVSIQVLFLHNAKVPHGFVWFSVLVGSLHGMLTLSLVLRECLQDEFSTQARSVYMGTALLPGTQLASCPIMPLNGDSLSAAPEQQKQCSSSMADRRRQAWAGNMAGGGSAPLRGSSSEACQAPVTKGSSISRSVEIPDLL